MQEIIDAIFQPASNLMNQAYSAIIQANLIAYRGLDIGRYMGPLAWLGPSWLALIKSVFLAAALVLAVYMARVMFDLYLTMKEAVKWW